MGGMGGCTGEGQEGHPAGADARQSQGEPWPTYLTTATSWPSAFSTPCGKGTSHTSHDTSHCSALLTVCVHTVCL